MNHIMGLLLKNSDIALGTFFVALLFMLPIKTSAQISDKEHDEILQLAIERQREKELFAGEFASYTLEVRKDSIRSLLKKLYSINEIDFASPEAVIWYDENKKNIYSDCRKLVRLAFMDSINYEYTELLRKLSEIFLNGPRDYAWSLTLLLEAEWLEDNLSGGENEELESLFNLCKQHKVGYMNLLWPSAFLFGIGNKSSVYSYICQQIGIDYCEQEDYSNGELYLEQSEIGYFPRKSLSGGVLRCLNEIYRKTCVKALKEKNKLYQNKIYRYDQSIAARRLRNFFLPVIDQYAVADFESALFYREIGLDYLTTCEYAQAIYYLKKSMECYECALGFQENALRYDFPKSLRESNYKMYKHTLYCLGKSYEAISNYKEALYYLNKCIQRRDKEDELTWTDLMVRIDAAMLELKSDHLFKAMSLFTEVQAIMNSGQFYMDFLPDLGGTYSDKSQVVNILSIYLQFAECRKMEKMKEYNRSLSNRMEITNDLEDMNFMSSRIYSENLFAMAETYLKMDSIDLTLGIIEKYKKKLRNDKDKISIENAKISLLESCCYVNNPQKQLILLENAYEEAVNYVKQILPKIQENTRIDFMKEVGNVFNRIISECVSSTNRKDGFAACAFNCSLFQKELQLYSIDAVRRLVLDSGDKKLLNNLDSLFRMKSDLTEFSFDKEQIVSNESFINSICEEKEDLSLYFLLEEIGKRKEEEVLRKEKEFKIPKINFYEHEFLSHPVIQENVEKIWKNLYVTWPSLQKIMKDDEILVEFCTFGNRDSEAEKMYVAFVLENKGIPLMINLFRQSDIDKVPKESFYSTVNLTRLVWKPLMKYIEAQKVVYFTGAGSLLQIGIEYLPDQSGLPLCWNLPLYRLTSFRELISTVPIQIESAVLCGISQFGDSQKNQEAYAVTNHYLGVPELLPEYATVKLPPLSYSECEVEECARFLRRKGVKTDVLTGIKEEEIKQLSSSPINLLHLSTHAFFQESPLINLEETRYKEDALLNCSALFCNGVLDILKTGKKTGLEDGILTAREIACLDFRQVHLLLLSACMTGKGFITEEGSYGLQRGFKKAGAGCILMTLRGIEDAMTYSLMKRFYLYLASGFDPRESMIKAQKEMYYGQNIKVNDFYSSFILTDALREGKYITN